MTEEQGLALVRILESFYPSQIIPELSEETFVAGLMDYKAKYSVEEAMIAIRAVGRNEPRFPSWKKVEDTLQMERRRTSPADQRLLLERPKASKKEEARNKRFWQLFWGDYEKPPHEKGGAEMISQTLHKEFGCPEMEACDVPGCEEANQ